MEVELGRRSRDCRRRSPGRRCRAGCAPCARRARPPPRAGRGCRSRPSRSRRRARSRPRAARAPGSPEQRPRLRRARPGRGRDGRRRGRRRGAAPGRAAPAARPTPSSSETSRTRAENARASGVPSRSPYSFIAEPQPAALTTTWSSRRCCGERRDRAPGRARSPPPPRRRGARARRSSRAARGASTSNPSAASARDRRRGGPAGIEDALHAARAAARRARAGPRRPGCARAAGRRLGAAASAARPWRAPPAARAAARPAAARPAASTGASARRRLGVRERLEQQPAQRPLGRGRSWWRSTCGRDALDQPVVADARRARGHARHAAQAAVEVGDHLVRQLGRRRLSPSPISTIRPRGESASAPHSTYVGQRVQAEAAVDAVVDHVLLGRALGVERRHLRSPPTNSPGLQVPAGSKRALTLRISSSAGRSAAAPRIELGAQHGRARRARSAARRRRARRAARRPRRGRAST